MVVVAIPADEDEADENEKEDDYADEDENDDDENENEDDYAGEDENDDDDDLVG